MFQIEVENIKCSGCANSIQKALIQIAGVESTNVNPEKGIVIIIGNADRSQIVSRLAALGYPEKGANTALCKAKSYVSCAVGRLS